jgi:hypothetical protein
MKSQTSVAVQLTESVMMSCTLPTSKQYTSYYSISVSEVGKTIHFRDIISTKMNVEFLIMQFNEILLSF